MVEVMDSSSLRRVMRMFSYTFLRSKTPFSLMRVRKSSSMSKIPIEVLRPSMLRYWVEKTKINNQPSNCL